jgi:hypothetical protein
MSQRRQRLRPECANCAHDRSNHQYDPADQGRALPRLCRLPGCPCANFRRAAFGERIGKRYAAAIGVEPQKPLVLQPLDSGRPRVLGPYSLFLTPEVESNRFIGVGPR